jgi:hypothetical protein
MGQDIPEKEENTEKQIQGKSWYRKTKNVQFVQLLFFAGFCQLRACISQAHTHTINGWKGIFDIVRLGLPADRGRDMH